jgi:single-stranded-DNA-specific exonuclease
MSAAVNALLEAVRKNKRIVLYGDYDVDGITSCVLLARLLRKLGATIGIFLPNRMDEGYGLSPDGVERCLATHQPSLLIAVDCGTGSAREIARLACAGVEVIVLDHHLPVARNHEESLRPSVAPLSHSAIAQSLPVCTALVNPKLAPSNSPWFDLCSVGIAFKLCHALLIRARESGLAEAAAIDLRQFLDLVAVGTIADVVPLVGENRIFARAGLEQLRRTQNLGLHELKRLGGVPSSVAAHHVSFRIAPRLNAAGRLTDAMLALECLLTDDPARAAQLAENLDEHNRQRQSVQAQMLDEAREQARALFEADRDRVLVVAREGWHVGVVGIVAARLMQEFYRPAVVIGVADGVGRGSCRSVEGLHIVETLRACSGLLEKFGGHEMAAGLTIRAENIPALRERLNAAARAAMSGADLLRAVRVDATVSLGDLDGQLMNELEQLGPFGAGNPPPLLAAIRLRCVAPPKTVGKDGKHLRLWLSDETGKADAIGFNMAQHGVPDGPLDVAFTPEWNEYQGSRRVQLNLKAIRASP